MTSKISDLDDNISTKSKSNTKELNERINIFNCVEKIICSLEIDIADNGIAIYNSIRKDDFTNINPTYLERVLYYLISNGIKYKSDNRNSTVILQSVHAKPNLKFWLETTG